MRAAPRFPFLALAALAGGCDALAETSVLASAHIVTPFDGEILTADDFFDDDQRVEVKVETADCPGIVALTPILDGAVASTPTMPVPESTPSSRECQIGLGCLELTAAELLGAGLHRGVELAVRVDCSDGDTTLTPPVRVRGAPYRGWLALPEAPVSLDVVDGHAVVTTASQLSLHALPSWTETARRPAGGPSWVAADAVYHFIGCALAACADGEAGLLRTLSGDTLEDVAAPVALPCEPAHVLALADAVMALASCEEARWALLRDGAVAATGAALGPLHGAPAASPAGVAWLEVVEDEAVLRRLDLDAVTTSHGTSISVGDRELVLADDSWLAAIDRDRDRIQLIATVDGAVLETLTYQPPLRSLRAQLDDSGDAFVVLAAGEEIIASGPGRLDRRLSHMAIDAFWNRFGNPVWLDEHGQLRRYAWTDSDTVLRVPASWQLARPVIPTGSDEAIFVLVGEHGALVTEGET